MRLIILLSRSWPVNAVTLRLSAAKENWEGPKPLICTKDLLQIEGFTDVIRASERFTFLVQVFNCSFVGCCKENVETQEHSHQHCDNTSEYIADLNSQRSNKFLFVTIRLRVVESINLPLDGHHEFIE